MDGISLNAGISTYIILSSILVLVIWWLFKKPSLNLPPGPRDWATTIKIMRTIKDESLHELATEWAREYGPMTFFSYFGQGVLCLNSPDMVRRLLGSDEFKHLVARRSENTATRVAGDNGKDLIFTVYNSHSKQKRRTLFSVIGLYGDGVKTFENVVSGEMDRLMEEIDQYENQDFELWRSLAISLKNIIYILVLGERPDDVAKPKILEEYDIAYNKLLSPEYELLLTKFPILAKVPGKFKKAVERLKNATAKAQELVYYGAKRTWVPGRPRGIADYLFDLENKPGYEWMKDDPQHTINFLTSLFWTAHLTTRASVLGIFLCLINHPRVAKKLQEEIDRVLGERRPRLEDKSSLPYVEATVFEVLRFITQVPMGGMRSASEDVHIDGVTIPKNTLILINAWFYHRNEEKFEDPWTFNPERFLDNEGRILPPDHPIRKNLLPFGAGLRSCPGDIFARARVFMFMTMILQKYDILPPANEKLVPADFRTNQESVNSFIRQVPPYFCRLQRRHKTAQ